MALAHWCALVVAVIATVVLARLQRRHVAAVRRDRAGLFESASGVLHDARVRPRGLDFPVLYGTFEGRAVRVEPVVDAVGMRTVPVLRLAVTVRDRRAGQGRMSVLSDETGQEFYAQHRELTRLRHPAWPAHVSVATDRTGASTELLDAAVEIVARDSSLKQVLVTDRGVRCVVRAAQSDAATYRVTRRVDLSGTRVSPMLLAHALATANALCDLAGRAPASQRAGA